MEGEWLKKQVYLVEIQTPMNRDIHGDIVLYCLLLKLNADLTRLSNLPPSSFLFITPKSVHSVHSLNHHTSYGFTEVLQDRKMPYAGHVLTLTVTLAKAHTDL